MTRTKTRTTPRRFKNALSKRPCQHLQLPGAWFCRSPAPGGVRSRPRCCPGVLRVRYFSFRSKIYRVWSNSPQLGACPNWLRYNEWDNFPVVAALALPLTYVPGDKFGLFLTKLSTLLTGNYSSTILYSRTSICLSRI